MSPSLLASIVLVTYAIALVAIFRLSGFGVAATLALGVLSTLAIWGSLHLIYFSDFLYTPPVSGFLPQQGIAGALADVEYVRSGSSSWIPLYFAALGWRFGIAFYLVAWMVARLLMRWLPSRKRKDGGVV
jgi:hypothetical protein